MNFPPDLLYGREHLWLRREPDGTITIGITDFAQGQLGRVVFVDLPPVGGQVTAGKEMGAVESAKSVSDLISPISGQVRAINEALSDTPTLLNDETYGQGWLAVVVPSGPLPGDLMSAEQYRATVE